MNNHRRRHPSFFVRITCVRIAALLLLLGAIPGADLRAGLWPLPAGTHFDPGQATPWQTGKSPGPDEPTARVLIGEHLSLFASPGNQSIQIHANNGGTWVPIGHLSCPTAASDGTPRIATVEAWEQYEDAASLRVTWRQGSASAATIVIRMGFRDPFVACSATSPQIARLDCGARFAVQVDGLGYDNTLDAQRIPGGRLRLPSDHHAIQLVPGGNALLLAAWTDARQDIQASLAGEGRQRSLALDIALRPEHCGELRFGALTGKDLWAAHDMRDLATGEGTACGWRAPFPAEWRVEMPTLPDGWCDSWRPASQLSDGTWAQYWSGKQRFSFKGTRTMWQSVRGQVPVAAFLAGGETGELHLVRHAFTNVLAHIHHPDAKDLVYDPSTTAVVFPFMRTPETPPGQHGVLEWLRTALSGTAATAIADGMFAKRAERNIYPATCALTAGIEQRFIDGQEASQRRQILHDFWRMDNFVVGIRSRIDAFLAWNHRFQLLVAAHRGAAPELADRFSATANRLQAIYDERKERMSTPEKYLALSARMAALVDAPAGVDREEEAKELGRAIRVLGGAQDGCIGCMRMVVRELRWNATRALAEAGDDPRRVGFCVEVRDLCREILATYFSHEGNPTWAP